MTLFRIKKQAKPFFKAKIRDLIKPYDFWKEKDIDSNALEEVKDVYVVYGIDRGSSTSLSGHDGSEQQTHIDFTLHGLNVNYNEYQEISNRDNVSLLCYELEEVFRNYINQFKQTNQ